MTTSLSRLDDLRREIDALDSALLETLARRFAVMHEVKAAKGGGGSQPVLRPGREAAILRRLAGDNAGRVPLPVLLRLWREIISASAAVQGPLALAVCAPSKSVGFGELARNQFGSAIPMSLHRSAKAVLRAAAEVPGTVAVLPLPMEGEDDPWWTALVADGHREETPSVIWRLPFLEGTGRFEEVGAYAVAAVQPEPSGDDVTLCAIETGADVSRASVRDGARARGLEVSVIATDETGGGRMNLVEIAGFLPPGDPRLADLRAAMPEQILRTVVIGAHARPLKTADFANR